MRVVRHSSTDDYRMAVSMTFMDLTGKTAVVTGASLGIGFAIAQRLVESGARVVLTSRDAESAERAAAEIGDSARGVGAHAADEDEARRCLEYAIDEFGSVDILVNNAGTNPALGRVTEQSRAKVFKTLEVNTWAPVMWTGLAADQWMAEHGGTVIHTASASAFLLTENVGVYGASKGALVHLTKYMARELAPRIRVNAIAPGVVRTRMSQARWRDGEDETVARIPLGRLGEPSDIAAAALFLASDASSWMTGTTLTIDGGESLL